MIVDHGRLTSSVSEEHGRKKLVLGALLRRNQTPAASPSCVADLLCSRRCDRAGSRMSGAAALTRLACSTMIDAASSPTPAYRGHTTCANCKVQIEGGHGIRSVVGAQHGGEFLGGECRLPIGREEAAIPIDHPPIRGKEIIGTFERATIKRRDHGMRIQPLRRRVRSKSLWDVSPGRAVCISQKPNCCSVTAKNQSSAPGSST